MRRFYLPPEQANRGSLQLDRRESHHALDVLRLRPGDRVEVLDGAGAVISAEVAGQDRHNLALNVLERVVRPPSPCRLTLLQAIPKGKTFEAIIQKATELGAYAIVPLLTERTEVHIDPPDAPAKVTKWRQTAIESIKQCGLPWIPRIESPVRLRAWLEGQAAFDLQIVASLAPGALHPRRLFEDRAQGGLPRPGSIAVWVGPEGDFSSSELDAILKAGAHPITLGPRVLRADTAATCCLAILNYELGQ